MRKRRLCDDHAESAGSSVMRLPDLELAVVEVVAAQVTGVVDLEILAVVDQQAGQAPALARVFCAIDGERDVAGVLAGHSMSLPTRCWRQSGWNPAASDGRSQDVRAAIQEQPVDIGQHRAEVVRAERALQAQRAEPAAAIAALVGQERAVLGGADAAVELDRTGDVGRAAAVVRRRADATRVQQLAVVEQQAEVEEALVLGEERALVAEEGFLRAKFTTSESLSTWPKSG
jgi:hypothetical protein